MTVLAPLSHQAMSMALPVLATNWSGTTEFLDDTVGTGDFRGAVQSNQTLLPLCTASSRAPSCCTLMQVTPFMSSRSYRLWVIGLCVVCPGHSQVFSTFAR